MEIHRCFVHKYNKICTLDKMRSHRIFRMSYRILRCIWEPNGTNSSNREPRSSCAKRVGILISNNLAKFYDQCKLGSCLFVRKKISLRYLLFDGNSWVPFDCSDYAGNITHQNWKKTLTNSPTICYFSVFNNLNLT